MVVLEEVQTNFQNIKVIRNDTLGKHLSIDDCVQFSEYDEHAYHEMMVHVPMAYKSICNDVLVVGGGDGGVVRELCKYRNVPRITLVDIDKTVLEICRRHFPTVSNQLGNKNVRVFIQDANKYIIANSKKQKFDIVIFDVTDFGASNDIFQERTMYRLQTMLRENAIVIFNFNNINFQTSHLMVEQIRTSNIGRLFKYVYLYTSFVASNGGVYCFAFMSNYINPKKTPTIDHKLRNVRYYTPDMHTSSFNLPKEMIVSPLKQKLGMHYIIDVQRCRNVDKMAIDSVLEGIIDAAGLTELKRQSHMFTPMGYTVVILLSESHLSVHTWPEFNAACFDLFTCSKSTMDTIAVQHVISSLIGGEINMRKIVRECAIPD